MIFLKEIKRKFWYQYGMEFSRKMSAGRARRIDKMMTTLINGYYKCLSSESKKDDKNHNNFGKMFSLQWWIKI